MSVAAGVSDAAITVREKLRGKIGQTKVNRYFPGQEPRYGKKEEEDDIDIRKSIDAKKAFNRDDDDVAVMKDDRRLRRLAEGRVDNREEIRADHRRIRQAEIISSVEEDYGKQEAEQEEEDEDALEERRRRIREKLLQREQEEASSLIPDEEEDEEPEEESEDESEYETDSEDETNGIAMIKPVFIPKSQRDTIAERERLEEEERKLEELVKKRMQERKVETKRMVVEEIRKDEEIQRNLETEANVEDVDTDDEVNEAEEYEAWKVREIARIKRDREERDAKIKEREEIEKVRNMTEEERREWERRNPKLVTKESKQKWKFMQKYYHKGAFFQDKPDDSAGTAGEAEIYRRDYSEPTGDDKLDKSILPKVMQVKHFGRSGRTKWTHLVNEDTTDWNTPWTENGPLRAKYNTKMAGMNGPIAKPKGSKKLKDWETK